MANLNTFLYCGPESGISSEHSLGSTSQLEDMFAYGVSWSENGSTLTKIGNLSLFNTLPVQSQYRGCVYDTANKQVKYWLRDDNWNYKEDGTASLLDGTDGDIMVHTPCFFGKSGISGTTYYVKISTIELPGYMKIPEMYTSAYHLIIDNNNKARSITSNAYNGGANEGSVNGVSMKGKPRTNISRATMRTFCKNNNMEILCYEYYKWIMYWACVIEFCSFNTQINTTGSSSSDGATYIPSGQWNAYCSYRPFFNCGCANGKGNGTGKYTGTSVSIPSDGTNAARTVYPFKYRGFENPHSYLWINLDGFIGAVDSNNIVTPYTTTDPSYFDDNTTGKTAKPACPKSNGWLREFQIGTTGDIFAKTIGGSEKQDYAYYSSQNGARTLLVGGAASAGSNAGFGCLHAHGAVSAASSSVGFLSSVVIR